MSTEMPDENDRRIARRPARSLAITRSVILALNKMDNLIPPDRMKAHVEAYWSLAPTAPGQEPPAPWDWIMLSATRGDNRQELLEQDHARHLPEGPLYYPEDQITDKQEREIAAELIREQVLLHLKQEVPHSVAVVVEQFDERKNGSGSHCRHHLRRARFAKGHPHRQRRPDAEADRRRCAPLHSAHAGL